MKNYYGFRKLTAAFLTLCLAVGTAATALGDAEVIVKKPGQEVATPTDLAEVKLDGNTESLLIFTEEETDQVTVLKEEGVESNNITAVTGPAVLIANAGDVQIKELGDVAGADSDDAKAAGISIEFNTGCINIEVCNVSGGSNGIEIMYNEGTVDIEAGNVTAGWDGITVNVYNGGKTEINTSSIAVFGEECVTAISVNQDEGDSEHDGAIIINVNGDVIAESDEGSAVGIAADGASSIIIEGDLIVEGNGVEFTGGTNETTDIIIDGRLDTQGTAVVLKNEEAAIGESLTMTVWQMNCDKDGDYVKREVTDEDTNEKKLVADRASEQAIQYIIKIDENQTNMINTRGTMNYMGRDIAHEGDTVTLMINVPEGMEIDEVYGNREKTKLYKNEEGQYFMVIPRGGGVLFSLTLRTREAEEEIAPKPDPEPKPVPQPEPEPQPEPQPEPEPAPKPEPKPDPQPAPQPEPQPAPVPQPQPEVDVVPQPDPKPIEEEKSTIVIVVPLVALSDLTGNLELNFYPSGIFTVHIKDGRNISGRFSLIDDTIWLESNDGVRMSVAPDGALNFIVGPEEIYTFQFPMHALVALLDFLK